MGFHESGYLDLIGVIIVGLGLPIMVITIILTWKQHSEKFLQSMKRHDETLLQSMKQHDETLLLHTFETITGFVDTTEALDDRKTLYDAKKSLGTLISNFPSCMDTPNGNNYTEDEVKNFKKINRAAWQTAVSYDRVCFLIEQNKQLKKQIIEFHGTTILKNFIIMRGLMIKWIDTRGRSSHPYFMKTAKEIWQENEYKKNDAITNLKTAQEFLYDNYGHEIDINNVEKWEKFVFSESKIN